MGLNVHTKYKEMFRKYWKMGQKDPRECLLIQMPDKVFPKPKWDELIVQQLSSLTP